MTYLWFYIGQFDDQGLVKEIVTGKGKRGVATDQGAVTENTEKEAGKERAEAADIMMNVNVKGVIEGNVETVKEIGKGKENTGVAIKDFNCEYTLKVSY